MRRLSERCCAMQVWCGQCDTALMWIDTNGTFVIGPVNTMERKTVKFGFDLINFGDAHFMAEASSAS